MVQKEFSFIPRLLIGNNVWQSGPSSGFLTPTALRNDTDGVTFSVYGAVRDKFGRGVIRRVLLSSQLKISAFEEISYDRRGSESFDTDGTILGHVNSVNEVIRLYYIGFKRSQRVKFQAFSGLAESVDQGRTFKFKRRILHESKFPFLKGYEPDIVACHWNDLNHKGDGLALVSIGNGWLEIGKNVYPKYSSYLIEVTDFEFAGLVSQFPQRPELYRLGRPRFLGNEKKIAVATGGRVDGDYRPYFFEYTNGNIIERDDLEFEILPGSFSYCRQQVSYPEFVELRKCELNLFLFNGDRMGEDGCYGITSKEW